MVQEHDPDAEQAKEQAKRIYSPGRGGHQGRDHRRPAGPRHQRQAGQARGAAHRRPGPQQRDLAGRPHRRSATTTSTRSPTRSTSASSRWRSARSSGFTKLQLYDLGHDGAAARRGQGAGPGRDPQQDHRPRRAGVADHAGRIRGSGALTLFAMRSHDELPYRSILVAHEHHMKTDLTGYPKSRPRPLARHLLPHRGGGRRLRCRHHAAELPDGTDRAGPGAARDVGEPEARLRHGAGEGAHQPHRHLSGGDLRHSRHLRDRPRGRAQPRGPAAQPSPGADRGGRRTAARSRRRARW